MTIAAVESSRRVQGGTEGWVETGEQRTPRTGEFIAYLGNIWECLDEDLWKSSWSPRETIMKRPWRKAQEGDRIRLTGKGTNNPALYSGVIRRVENRTNGKAVYFEKLPADSGARSLTTSDGRDLIFVNNEESRFDILQYAKDLDTPERYVSVGSPIAAVVAEEPHWYL